MRQLRFKTESGTVYQVDFAGHRLTRIRRTARSGHLRTEAMEYEKCSSLVIGQPMQFLGEPLTAGADFRLIETTPVVAIEEEPYLELA